ncbi:hypothetical protein NFI96_010087 [Prochilodus magdalenae]|nr:hypothetical protein NFI96_010087 [Prochilodus magdalenae]
MSSPEVCALTKQVLQAEAEEIDRRWEELHQTLCTLAGGIHTSTSQSLSSQLEKERARWTEVKQDLTHTSVRLHALLEAWKRYSALIEPCTLKLWQYRDRFSALSAAEPERSTERLAACVQDLQELVKNTHCLQTDLDRVHEASKELTGQMEAAAAAFVQSECRLLTRGCLQFEEAVKGKLGEVQSGLLELSSHSADLELLNGLSYRLTLSDLTTQKLQSLNKQWAQASSHAQERCRQEFCTGELQAASLRTQGFEQRCESWMVFLQRMEDSVAGEISSSYAQLRQQLRTHQAFQG